ncbi:MAG TPA: aspartate-semialdehyde dehydrogenase [Bacteroidales bacterium]|nr:aspartate-semialdehyde dehydrogenase [Bacteroidales bacterium]HRZ47992.1 aspartate-semialdehyde dehydrogenase [Bacteroidales bacterium]
MKIAVIGATGLVGQMMLRCLEESTLPVTGLIPAASARSAGRMIPFRGTDQTVVTVEEAVRAKPDLALFSAGGAAALQYAPLFAKAGCTVIDNSSAWRREPGVPLVVPEVNGHLIGKDDRIIANPNCSTIQLVVALNPLHKAFGIKRIVVSTYQSVSGSGVKGLRQLDDERNSRTGEKCYPHPIDLNVIPQGGTFLPNGITVEEEKLIYETRKIIGDPGIAITATVVRVPVQVSHSESVNIEFFKPVTPQQVKEVLQSAPGIRIMDHPEESIYPTPLMAAGKDEVFVGRIRQDASLETAVDMWIVSDNVRKGAATNAVQIAEILRERNLL